MKSYRTVEVAKIIGVHPNTVRLYEEWGFIPKPERQGNGYRIFTDFHIEQLRVVRLALQIEVVQSGLRKKIVQMLKISASGDFDTAIFCTMEYLQQLRKERFNAEDAAKLVEEILLSEVALNVGFMKRREVSKYLSVSIDTLRNWEMNGLLTIKRKENGYRIYTSGDIRRLKIIRCLRSANYSLEAILQLLCQLSRNRNINIVKSLNTTKNDDGIISVCDRLITSLLTAESNAKKIVTTLKKMKTSF